MEKTQIEVFNSFIICFAPLSHPLAFHFILFWGCCGLKQTVDMCGSKSALSARARTHTCIHTCTERGQCFSDEKPVCLFHIPLVPGATSEGGESTQTFLQDADVRIKSQTASCTQQGEKDREEERRASEQRKGKNLCWVYGCIFLNILFVETQKALYAPSTNSQNICKQSLHSPQCFYLHL